MKSLKKTPCIYETESCKFLCLICLCCIIIYISFVIINITISFCRYSDLPVVHLKDLTSLHLITFHPTTDILPLIMANCQYTFEIDKGTRQEYIFTDLENQLIDRFLFSKSVISWSSLSEVRNSDYTFYRYNEIDMIDEVQH